MIDYTDHLAIHFDKKKRKNRSESFISKTLRLTWGSWKETIQCTLSLPQNSYTEVLDSNMIVFANEFWEKCLELYALRILYLELYIINVQNQGNFGLVSHYERNSGIKKKLKMVRIEILCPPCNERKVDIWKPGKGATPVNTGNLDLEFFRLQKCQKQILLFKSAIICYFLIAA